MRRAFRERLYRSIRRAARSQQGFALLAAILACLILFAVGMLVIQLSTQDIRTSARSVGDKKALSAVETGIHRMAQNFNPDNLAASAVSNAAVDSTNDPNTLYTVGTPARPTSGPEAIPMAGYSIGGGQQWGQKRYNVDVTGRSTSYNTTVTVGVGLGFGPIEITTMSR